VVLPAAPPILDAPAVLPPPAPDPLDVDGATGESLPQPKLAATTKSPAKKDDLSPCDMQKPPGRPPARGQVVNW